MYTAHGAGKMVCSPSHVRDTSKAVQPGTAMTVKARRPAVAGHFPSISIRVIQRRLWCRVKSDPVKSALGRVMFGGVVMNACA